MGIPKEKIEELLQNSMLRSDQVFSDPPVCIKISGEYGDQIFSTLGNFSLLLAPPKVGKTTAAMLPVVSLLRNEAFLNCVPSMPPEKNSIYWIDTEQGKHEGVKIVRTVSRLTTGQESPQPANFHYFSFRQHNNATKLELTDYLIENSKHLGFVVIDGIRDFVSSINNEIEATKIAEKLLKWTETKNIHILAILHQNKGDGNARGHLGTELINKAETVARIKREEQGLTRLTVIEADLSRHREFEKFAFTIDINGNFETVEITGGFQPEKPKANELTHYQIEDALKITFAKEKQMPYSKFVMNLKESLKNIGVEFGDNKTKELIKHLQVTKYIDHNKQSRNYSPAIPV